MGRAGCRGAEGAAGLSAAEQEDGQCRAPEASIAAAEAGNNRGPREGKARGSGSKPLKTPEKPEAGDKMSLLTHAG